MDVHHVRPVGGEQRFQVSGRAGIPDHVGGHHRLPDGPEGGDVVAPALEPNDLVSGGFERALLLIDDPVLAAR